MDEEKLKLKAFGIARDVFLLAVQDMKHDGLDVKELDRLTEPVIQTLANMYMAGARHGFTEATKRESEPMEVQ